MKYYKINPQILFRHYGDFGYLTDNRNFGYNFLNEEFVLGDEIISETGADIVSCLKKEPLSINDILNSVYRIFGYENGLEHDVIEFLELLCSKGFIISGSTEEECANGRFEFKVLTNESRNQEKGNSPIETQTFLPPPADGTGTGRLAAAEPPGGALDRRPAKGYSTIEMRR